MVSLESFEFVSTVDVIVPSDYDHDQWLRQFMERRGQEFVRPSSVYEKRASFTEEISTRLLPNQCLVADFYDIKTSVSSHECLDMVVAKNGLLLGTRGTALLCTHATSSLTKVGRYFSFNKEDNLPIFSDGGEANRCIPTLFAKEEPKIAFVHFNIQHDPQRTPHRYGVVVFHSK